MRYTLRLLTLDQLARAAGLVCALELERSDAGARYGAWPFEIGLWVGKAATPNILGRKGDGRPDSARAKVTAFKKNPDRNPSPIPLENCPWCGREFEPESFDLQPNAEQPNELRIVCANWECDFSGDRPLPVIGVDEPLYRRLPAFLIATVDKFASLPWVGQSGALLGGADRADARRLLRRRRTGAGEAADGAAPAPRPRHPGRAAPDCGAARHHGRPLRDGDRGAGGARGGRAGRQAEDRRFDRDGAARAGPDSGAVRAADDAGVPPAGSEPPRHVLRPDGAVVGDAGAAVRGHRLAGPEPQGPDAPGPAGADGGGAAGLARGGGRREPAEPRRPLHDGAGLLQQPARAGRGAAHPRGGGAHHRRALRDAAPGRRDAPPVSRPYRLLRAGGADLARVDRPGGRGAAAARVPVRRPAQPRRLRAGDEHDLGRPRHPAPRADAGAGAAEGARRVHPGDEPRGAFRRGPGPGGDPAQRPQAPRPFALRAVPPLSRDLLPLGRGGQRHPVLAARPRPRLRGRAGGPGAPPRAGVDARARGRAHRRRARRPRAAAPRRVRGTGRAAALRGGRRARGTDAERAGPRGRISSTRGGASSTTITAPASSCSTSATS